jgi:hypothetical protein
MSRPKSRINGKTVKRTIAILESVLGLSGTMIRNATGGTGRTALSRWRAGETGMDETKWWNLLQFLEAKYGILQEDLLAKDAEDRIRRKLERRRERHGASNVITVDRRQNKAEPEPRESGDKRLKITETIPTGDPDVYLKAHYELTDEDLARLEGPTPDSMPPIPTKGLTAFATNQTLIAEFKITADEIAMLARLNLPEWLCTEKLLLDIIRRYRVASAAGGDRGALDG